MNINFELILFYATVITGLVSLFDIFFLAGERKRKHPKKKLKLPIVIEYSRAFFPILLLVFLLRSFLLEPFRIPSPSLEPTLLINDFILVNKFKYGLRLPILHDKILNNSEPKRGDIMVFRWPPNPSVNFIKRVIGLPGDKIIYINKELYINGDKIPQTYLGQHFTLDENGMGWQLLEKEENLLGVKHKIYIEQNKPSHDYNSIIVPPHMYFVMGDNRDNSADSRYFGFVPEENIVGKAMIVWMSWDSFNKAVRWQRLGKLIH